MEVHPERVVIATGATELHPVFPGNDLPGVMLGRAAAGLVRRGVKPGARAVVVVEHDEGFEHLEALRSAGVRIAAVVVPVSLESAVPDGLRTLVGAVVLRAEGKERVRFAVLRDVEGVTRGIGCDVFVLSTGRSPRDDLLRMSAQGEPVEVVGDAAAAASPTEVPATGYVCLCEDVSVADLERAWDEGYRSSELLKRYTTVTMGPCQGAMCGRHLAAFAAARGAAANAAGRTTARPLARPTPLEILAAPVHEVIDKRTSLHDLHVAAGARMGWSGSWLRPFAYGDPEEEYRAVRERVSVMDVGTLGKFLVTGPDASDLIDEAFPTRVDDLDARDALVTCSRSTRPGTSSTTDCCARSAPKVGTSPRRRAVPIGWRRGSATGPTGGGSVPTSSTSRRSGGPSSSPVRSLASSSPGSRTIRSMREAFPHMGVREVTVAGVPCGAIRAGFVGEVAFELHHPRSRGPELWRAIAEAGAPLGLAPHGLDALEVLRLEKGHPYVGQDTLPDDTPAKLGLEWAVHPGKRFAASRALERLGERMPERKLVGLEFDRGGAELRGVPLRVGARIVGRVTSAARSPILDRSIGLGWIRREPEGPFPDELRADRVGARVVPTPFYDPAGDRLRG